MHWGDIKLRYKLFCAFSLILSLLLIVGFIGFRGVHVVTRNAQTVILSHPIKMIDHLNWMSKINRLWTDPQASRVDAQTDDHECAFGQWLYGPGRKQLESSYPDMAALLKTSTDTFGEGLIRPLSLSTRKWILLPIKTRD